MCGTEFDLFCLLVVLPSLDNDSASFTGLHVLVALGAMQVFFCVCVDGLDSV